MRHDDPGFAAGIVLAIILMCLVGLPVYGYFRSTFEIEAIKHGAAEYRINTNNYQREFVWKPTNTN